MLLEFLLLPLLLAQAALFILLHCCLPATICAIPSPLYKYIYTYVSKSNVCESVSPTLHNLLPTLCYLLCCCLPSFMHCAHVYIYSYRAQQNTMQHIIASQVKQKAALAGNPHRRRSRIQQQQCMPAHKFLTKSNQMGQSDEAKAPITTEMTLAGFHPGTVQLSGGPTIRHSSLCDIFTPLLFMDDYVRQALTDRTALLPEIQAQLKYFKHLVESYNDWEMEVGIEEDCNRQSAHHCKENWLCLSCGVNPGARHLGYDECSRCYDEH